MKLILNTSGISSILENIGDDILQVKYDTALEIVVGIMKESYLQCPKKTGTLAASQYISPEADKITFGYGGPNNTLRPSTTYMYGTRTMYTVPEYVNEYAEKVHENLIGNEFYNGKAKFLEDPINDYAPKANALMVNNFTDSLKGMVKWKGSKKAKAAAIAGGKSWIR